MSDTSSLTSETLLSLHYLIYLHNTLQCRFYHLHFTYQKTEAKRDTVICSRPHSCEVTGLEFGSMSDYKTHILKPTLDCSYSKVFITEQSNCIYIKIILVIITLITINTQHAGSAKLPTIYMIIANIPCVLLRPRF